MKRQPRRRLLAYEQLESKTAPSSILLVAPGNSYDGETVVVASTIATRSSDECWQRFETNQILRFVAENTTGGGHAHRTATLPTEAQCAAADEMMQLNPAEWNSLLVLGFYHDGTEL